MESEPTTLRATTPPHRASSIRTLFGFDWPQGAPAGRRCRTHRRRKTVTSTRFTHRFFLSHDSLRLLDDCILSRHPQAYFYVLLNGSGPFDDLEFQQYLPRLRLLGVNGNYAINLEPVRHHGGLERLHIAGRGVSLRPLEKHARLSILSIGERIRHHATIGTCTNLQVLNISGQNLKDLGFLTTLDRLRSLSFMLGGTRRFADLPLLQHWKISQSGARASWRLRICYR